ncbi:AbrB/MazE/SpoVT family DNA-binding domain-containing protein [Hyperthermus butylicus]|uniref:Transcriptional regulator n=1 Tax=Hyperthermus butylicus (strain DSM 5456 / JCM 9403 / PLM1-5) TaxID=415426 RepID=A2BJP3_HYPBU|nr:AbrB/MazE/SpoVT family DNA-binding domain-containing protein [Hyperthermus butylicus]ABM80204.1 putative transcriptional regulator [Hyperthermus butylicus DSM 5456]
MHFLVKVGRKGQITLPKEARDMLAIRENDYLVLRVEDGRIVIEKPEIPEPGEPVGEEEYKRLIEELEEMRRKWR